MSEYWAGVLIGFLTSTIFIIVCMFVINGKVCELREDFEELKTEHDQIAEWISDNETVMKTYEFFNENIKKLLEEKKENEEN